MLVSMIALRVGRDACVARTPVGRLLLAVPMPVETSAGTVPAMSHARRHSASASSTLVEQPDGEIVDAASAGWPACPG